MPRPSRKFAVQQYARERGWERIGRAEWEELRGALSEVSETTVRGALLDLQLPLEQPFAGIATKTLDELEASLLTMADAYPAARSECRTAVIAAKDRMRFAALNPKTDPEKRTVKAEMVEWMLVWLGDPAMFRSWVALRKRAGYCSSSDST